MPHDFFIQPGNEGNGQTLLGPPLSADLFRNLPSLQSIVSNITNTAFIRQLVLSFDLRAIDPLSASHLKETNCPRPVFNFFPPTFFPVDGETKFQG